MTKRSPPRACSEPSLTQQVVPRVESVWTRRWPIIVFPPLPRKLCAKTAPYRTDFRVECPDGMCYASQIVAQCSCARIDISLYRDRPKKPLIA